MTSSLIIQKRKYLLNEKKICQKFSVFMRSSPIFKLKATIPYEVLIVSDKRSYRNLTFDNVLARQGSSFCNRACLNFQAFPLRDMKWRPEKPVALVKG